MTFASANGGNLPFNMILATILLIGKFSKHFSKLGFRAWEVEFNEKIQVSESRVFQADMDK